MTPDQFQQQYGNPAEMSYFYSTTWYDYRVVQENVFRWNPDTQHYGLIMQNFMPQTRQTPKEYKQQYQDLTGKLTQQYGTPQPYQQNTTEGYIWYPPKSQAFLSYDQYWWMYRYQQVAPEQRR
jgi:hypothetical protein